MEGMLTKSSAQKGMLAKKHRVKWWHPGEKAAHQMGMLAKKQRVKWRYAGEKAARKKRAAAFIKAAAPNI